MEYRIRAYVDELFQSAPRTQRAYELKVELTQNLLDKYFALLSEGKSQDDAYNLTVMSIGDVQELFEGLNEDAPAGPPVAQPYVVPGTVVQDFKEWQSGKSQKKQLMKFIRSVFWPLVLVVYFLISFGTGKWYITWLIFLIAPAVDSIISATLTLQDKNGR